MISARPRCQGRYGIQTEGIAEKMQREGETFTVSPGGTHREGAADVRQSGVEPVEGAQVLEMEEHLGPAEGREGRRRGVRDTHAHLVGGPGGRRGVRGPPREGAGDARHGGRLVLPGGRRKVRGRWQMRKASGKKNSENFTDILAMGVFNELQWSSCGLFIT